MQTDFTQHKHLMLTGRTGYGKNINIVFVLFDKFWAYVNQTDNFKHAKYIL